MDDFIRKWIGGNSNEGGKDLCGKGVYGIE